MTPTIGEIRAFAGSYAPQGWALCNGQQLPINNNQVLYALIGSTYGPTTATTFCVPDLRGRLVVNQGQGPGRTSRLLGQAGGTEFVTLTDAQIGAHTHTAVAANNTGTTNNPANNYLAVCADATTKSVSLQSYYPVAAATAPTVVQLQTASISAQGGSQPHENRMPYVAINYIIALDGIYPQAQ